jgi:hypothetical protein
MVSIGMGMDFAQLSNIQAMFFDDNIKGRTAAAACGKGALWPYSSKFQTIDLFFAYAQMQLRRSMSQRQTAFKGIFR